MCGGLFNEFDMMSYFTGVKTEWWCWDCWKKSQYEAAKSEIGRRNRAAGYAERQKAETLEMVGKVKI